MKDCKRARARGASTEKGVNATDKERESGPGDKETEERGRRHTGESKKRESVIYVFEGKNSRISLNMSLFTRFRICGIMRVFRHPKMVHKLLVLIICVDG